MSLVHYLLAAAVLAALVGWYKWFIVSITIRDLRSVIRHSYTVCDICALRETDRQHSARHRAEDPQHIETHQAGRAKLIHIPGPITAMKDHDTTNRPSS